MYTVVGCPSCRELWIREAGGQRTSCPACETSHKVAKLRILFASEDIDTARDARTSLLADRSGHEDDDIPGFSELIEAADVPVIDQDEHLAAFGIDPATVAEAGEHDTAKHSSTRREIVTTAIESTDPSTIDHIVEAAAKEGLKADVTRNLLDRLERRGLVTKSDGRYRLL